jgi:DNA-binding MarR family transcriptional regulator
MDSVTGAALARQLNTSVPRISRAVERLGIDARQANGRLAFTPGQAARLRRALGVTPKIEGISRPETQVLAALRSAPFGLVSARAVARRSGLSPTTAARALSALHDRELVTRSTETIAAGRARRVEVWRANFGHRRWPRLDPVLAEVEAPKRRGEVEGRVPTRLLHLFWNTDEQQLDVQSAGPYIARRLLRTMDLQGLAWGARALGPNDWRQASRARGLDPKARQLARNLAEATG